MADRGSRRIPYGILPSRRNWKLNTESVLLLHCNGADAGTTFKDSGGTGHTVTAQNDAQLDTDESKWGGVSGLFGGDDDYLSIPDHADWDISTNWTVDLWVKHTDHAAVEMYIQQYEDNDNYWRIWQVHNDGIYFNIGFPNIVILGGGGEITDTNWHHLALCKVGNEYGIYLDGTQTDHVSDASMATFAGPIYIGCLGPGLLNFFDGWMDEIRIAKANPFGAAPVAGLTDTITVPIKPYISWR